MKNKEKKQISQSNYLNSCWDQAYNARQPKDYEWFINWSFYQGNQHLTIDRGTITQKKGDKVVINKIWTIVRGVRNYVLRNRPKAEVSPADTNEVNISQSVKLNKYLDYIHDGLHLRRKLKETVVHGLVSSVGIWQILWNPTLDEGEGNIEVNVIDPFDFYIDPKAKTIGKAQYVILAVKQNISDLEQNPDYDQSVVKTIKPDNEDYTSSFKTMLEKMNSQTTTSNRENGEVLVKEFWYKKEGKIYKAVVINDNYSQPLCDIETDYKELPFKVFSADVQPLSFYGFGWVKFLIPLQKALNETVQSQLDYNRLMNKGKYIIPKNTKVSVINSEHGQFLKTDKSTMINQLAIAPMANQINVTESNLNSYAEDIGALQEATRGRMPTGARSGKALEILQIGDANTMSELVENLEDFLESVYENILSIVARKYTTFRTVQPLAESKTRELFKVIGAENAPEELNEERQVVIQEKNIVDVKIASYLAETQAGRLEAIKDLAQIIDLPPEVILDVYGISNISDVVEKMKKQKIEEAQLEVNKNEAMAPPAQPQGVGRYAANAAVQTILQGGQPTLDQPPTQDYIDELDKFINEAKEQGIAASVIAQIENWRNQVAQQVV